MSTTACYRDLKSRAAAHCRRPQAFYTRLDGHCRCLTKPLVHFTDVPSLMVQEYLDRPPTEPLTEQALKKCTQVCLDMIVCMFV